MAKSKSGTPPRVELSNRQIRLIETAERFITESDDGEWRILPEIVNEITRRVTAGVGRYTYATTVTLGEDIAGSRTNFEIAGRSSVKRYDAAIALLKWVNLGKMRGAIVRGKEIPRKYRELESNYNNLNTQYEKLQVTIGSMFSKCPRCG